MLESVVAKKEICGLGLPNREKILAKLFANDSLLFLKAEIDNIRKALEIVQLFARASRLPRNMKKSRPISLIESNGFDYVGWTGKLLGGELSSNTLGPHWDATPHQNKHLSGSKKRFKRKWLDGDTCYYQSITGSKWSTPSSFHTSPSIHPWYTCHRQRT